MRTMVCFRTVDGRFALPIESTLSVRKIEGMVNLPAPRPGVLGVLPGDPPLSVLTSLGAGGDHVLIVVTQEMRYGLQVLEVLGVRRFEDDEMGPAPDGQQQGIISGTLGGADELTLVVDAHALAARL